MNLRLSRVHYPVTALGYGRRVGVWFQGCTIGCVGCMAQDTWSAEAGSIVAPEDVVAFIEDRVPEGLDGVTISGGEPFEQPSALGCLLQELNEWRRNIAQPVDLLCFSGQTYRRLEDKHKDILGHLDALVPEPFMIHRPTNLSLRGSANQPIVCLSPLGAERYGASGDDASPGNRRKLQVVVEGQSIWYIGIPGRGDLQRLAQSMEALGIVQEDVSWTE